METSSIPTRQDFDGNFDSGGGPQFAGNYISTEGGSINIGAFTDNKLPAKICELPNFLLSPAFTGRVDELQQIETAFSTSSSDLPQRCVIHGMPGVGKTQLALKFATLAFQRGQYNYVFWVSGASVENLSQDVSKAVDLLRLPGRYTMNEASKLTAARTWFEDSTVAMPWLLVVDNVNEETAKTVFGEFLPRENCKGKILMTARVDTITKKYTVSERSLQLALRPPGIDDAVAMLSAGVKTEQEDRETMTDPDAERLVLSVGSLPLAIDQAASYIRETECSVQEVLHIYNSNEVLEMLSWKNDLSRYEEQSVVASFMPALNRIQQTAPDAVILLRLFCFCDPEGIPLSIFTQACEALRWEEQIRPFETRSLDSGKAVHGSRQSLRGVSDTLRRKDRHVPVKMQGDNKVDAVGDLFGSPLRLSKAIQEVQRLSLAAQALEGAERIIRIHDLVHLLLRSLLITERERGQWLKITINVVCKAFKAIGDRRSPKNWSRCSPFISHIESLEGFAKQYNLEDTELLRASLSAAIYLADCGLYEKAATLSKRTLAQQREILSERHYDTLCSMYILGQVLIRLGKYEEADGVVRKTLRLSKSVLGKNHLLTFGATHDLAMVLTSLGKHEEAERIQRKTLMLSESTFGKKHHDTLATKGSLASILNYSGKHAEAERMSRETLTTEESILGKEHLDTLASMSQLAEIFNRQCRWEEAEELDIQVMEVRKRVLGKEHPSTLTSMNNLAHAWKGQNRIEEAISLMKDCLELENQVLGPEHPYTKGSLRDLREWEKERDEVEGSG